MKRAVIRRARDADVERIVLCYEWLFEPPGSRPHDWNLDQAQAALRQAVSGESAAVLIATLDGELVGLCTAYDDIESVRFGRGVWVEDLAVHPAQRSHGIGKQLLDEARRWASARGATHIQLVSGEARVEAHRFYSRERPDWRSINFGWQL